MPRTRSVLKRQYDAEDRHAETEARKVSSMQKLHIAPSPDVAEKPPAAHTQTLRQYERSSRERAITDGVNGTEYDRWYPAGTRLNEWLDAIRDAVSLDKSVVLMPRVLDDISRRAPAFFWRVLNHDYPSSIPDGYINPNVRRLNREHEAEMRAARRRGREAAEGRQ